MSITTTLTEEKLVMKLCRKCNQNKPTSEFYPSYPSQCKACHYPRTLLRHRKNPKIIEQRRGYREKYPWLATLLKINYRCNDPKCVSYKYYGGKGIKNLLTLKDLKLMWIRDNADKMKKPSIDRVDSNLDYKIDNCRYIEHSDNVKRRYNPNL